MPRIFNDSIYVFDYLKKDNIKLFDKNGKYLRTICSKGDGPNDFTLIQTFNINQYTDYLEVLSPWGELMIYDRHSGEKIKTINLKAMNENVKTVHDFICVNEFEYVFYSNATQENNIVVYDKQHETVKISTVPSKYIRSSSANKSLFLSADKKDILFNYIHDIVVYRYNGEKFMPFIVRDYTEKYNHIEKYINGDENVKEFNEKMTKYDNQFVSYLSIPYFNNKLFLGTSTIGNQLYVSYYDKIKQKSFFFSKFKEGVIFLLGTYSGEEYLYSFISPNRLSAFVNEKVLDAKNMEILKNIKEDDNPVVLRYKLKE